MNVIQCHRSGIMPLNKDRSSSDWSKLLNLLAQSKGKLTVDQEISKAQIMQ